MNELICNRYVITKNTPIKLLIAGYDPDQLITSSKLLSNDHVMNRPLQNHYVIDENGPE